MQTRIIYEDAEILVCEKPAGIAVESASAQESDVVSELKNYLSQNRTREPYLGVIHRLDQPVSGLLVFAKNSKAAANLSQQITDQRMHKYYHALVYGILDPEDGYFEHLLCKDAKTNKSFAVELESRISNKSYQPKKARLEYHCNRIIKTNVPGQIYSDVRIRLYTGRHHQIRVQFATVGNPLLGDLKYGTPESIALSKALKIHTPALCANKLIFEHPKTLEIMTFELPTESENEDVNLDVNE